MSLRSDGRPTRLDGRRSTPPPESPRDERAALGIVLIVGSGLALIAEFLWSMEDSTSFDDVVVAVLLVLLGVVGLVLLLIPFESSGRRRTPMGTGASAGVSKHAHEADGEFAPVFPERRAGSPTDPWS